MVSVLDLDDVKFQVPKLWSRDSHLEQLLEVVSA
jgi:hypothetical protein